MSTSVHTAIALRYPAPEWACYFEVANATGFAKSRSADAVAMNCWPSRGMEIHGFEVKTSRSDWLRERKHPEKSIAVQRFCDRWWIAVSDEVIVRPGELPATWGLLVLRGKKLVQSVEAPKLEAEPVSRTFMASMLRSGCDRFVDKAVVDEMVEQRIGDRVRCAEQANEAERKNAVFEIERLNAGWNELVEIAGHDIVGRLKTRFGVSEPQKLARAIRFVADGGLANEARALDNLREQAKSIVDSIDHVLKVARVSGG